MPEVEALKILRHKIGCIDTLRILTMAESAGDGVLVELVRALVDEVETSLNYIDSTLEGR